MTYTEQIHPHQSKKLRFLSSDYIPYLNNEGVKIYGVILLVDGEWQVNYQEELPAFGGYIARESIFGSPRYCPNATKHHQRHMEEYGSMPHLVFFDSAEAAEEAGFRKCKKCMKD